MATQTAPAAWWDETDEVIATVLAILEDQAAQIRKAGKRRGH